jgi:site-specific recombinase XerD
MNVFVQKTHEHSTSRSCLSFGTMLDKQEKPQTAILTNANGEPWTQSGLRQKLQAWAKERGHKVVPHGLRKNAVNSLFEAGCTAAEVSGITDQSIGMLEHYAKGRNKLKLGRAAIIKFDAARKAKA